MSTDVGGVSASNDGLGPMVEGEAYHEWLTAPPPDAMRCVDTRAAFAAGWSAAVAAERERCALIAVNGCLVPPDGGLPTDDERLLCDEIARRIRGA